MNIKQNYLDKTKQSININKIIDEGTYPSIKWTRKEWSMRIYLCSKRLLNAISLKINSEQVYKQNGSLIFPPIGLYYSLFHLGHSLLCIDYTTDLKDLQKIEHSKLITLINSKLVKRGLISSSLFETVKELKDYREHINYNFAPMGSNDFQDYFISWMIFIDIEEIFLEGIEYIKQLSQGIENKFDGYALIDKIRQTLADGWTDDIFLDYLSKEDMDLVNDYLISNQITN